MSAVTELGYMTIGVKGLSRWKDFAAEILGLEVVDEGGPGRCYLRMDSWHHRLILEEDGSDDMKSAGLRVAGPEEFAGMRKVLTEAGVKHAVCSRAQAEDRHVLELLTLEDPNGNPLEIFHGPHVQFSKPFYPGRRMYGRFETGTGGMGHCIMRNRDLDATYRFYRLLGMRGGIEYKIPTPDGNTLEALFMHCNDRDHTFAFGLGGNKRINHLMIQVDNIDDVHYTYELVQQRKIPIGVTLGKHSNDHQYSFYFLNPSGWLIEYGWGARPATHQSEYYQEDFYGHQYQPNVVNPNWEAVDLPSAAE
ncbi:MAG: VOC family protein [Alphaproteobacteria bacterium]|nr:VOC family protein [Alphaproteobacteria bacterium]